MTEVPGSTRVSAVQRRRVKKKGKANLSIEIFSAIHLLLRNRKRVYGVGENVINDMWCVAGSAILFRTRRIRVSAGKWDARYHSGI